MHRCDHWPSLIGLRIEIRHHGNPVRDGLVEAATTDATTDSSILWLHAEGVDGRTLYLADEGYEAWVEPATLPNDVYMQLICHRGSVGEGLENDLSATSAQ
ncbi:hypothetical protein SAMN04487912_105292 [Arthrobacter sp. cf158]|uniref:hypothetical protein n=1 Tax=Arthrobacter sp. cf158 TaxID=1761744 RepID=UPI00089D2A17|nr:hypothetical protein [Arthrobacter sp. cf158]SDW90030.1 hypothetical protein SAMN04487912_105292 [Arthrobacter sp. cf158]